MIQPYDQGVLNIKQLHVMNKIPRTLRDGYKKSFAIEQSSIQKAIKIKTLILKRIFK